MAFSEYMNFKAETDWLPFQKEEFQRGRHLLFAQLHSCKAIRIRKKHFCNAGMVAKVVIGLLCSFQLPIQSKAQYKQCNIFY